MFYIGCPMWSNKEWVGAIFPPRTPASEFLRLYSRRLSSVEGNTVFYALPSAETITRWREETPPEFRFCPKVLRSISHTAQLVDCRTETLQLVERVRGLGSRLGPLFLQLPPAFGPAQLPRLADFLAYWPGDVRLAVEVRHPDFYGEREAARLHALLSSHNVARVMMDTRPMRSGSAREQALLQARERKPDLPLEIVVNADFTFVRYIGHPRMETNAPFFAEWAPRLAQWLAEGKTAYVFCHCPFERHAPAICQQLYSQVSSLYPLPALGWQSPGPEGELEQGRLFE